jgi:hypothetical protein
LYGTGSKLLSSRANVLPSGSDLLQCGPRVLSMTLF